MLSDCQGWACWTSGNCGSGYTQDSGATLARYQLRPYHQCVPVNDDQSVAEQPLLDFSAGYVLRSIDQFPRAGSRAAPSM